MSDVGVAGKGRLFSRLSLRGAVLVSWRRKPAMYPSYCEWFMAISVSPISLKMQIPQKNRDCFVAEGLAPRNDGAEQYWRN